MPGKVSTVVLYQKIHKVKLYVLMGKKWIPCAILLRECYERSTAR